ncbi:twin-arginine translocase TatA/TatE family subunit [Mycetocola zhujimingii]|uniref:Sec-independent protein translocase protein TatA n=1 Tax=Mycetocola zhujimingii TaxID=2079792 RepID=A0A2U1TG78_9MICO|nr:twin-arginine translocase TatA/TatE family subunit [Mycetocola zhujimingii]AWB86343.1 hypothetical protein C3E77_06760 [Mycetocola zhujimingii]PWC07895.1 twin-arginine translocase TatA/TatE family subunit [Mycetocola zhujimingii]
MLGNLTGWHLLIIVFLVLLLFGAPKLPGLAKSLGQSMKIFKNEIKSDKPETTTPVDPTVPVAPTTTSATATPVYPTETAPPAYPTETATSSAPETHTKP